MSNYTWVQATPGTPQNFGVSGSWTPDGPPGSSDTAEINTNADVSGSGVAQTLNIDAETTIGDALTTTIGAIAIGADSLGGGGGVDVAASWTDTQRVRPHHRRLRDRLADDRLGRLAHGNRPHGRRRMGRRPGDADGRGSRRAHHGSDPHRGQCRKLGNGHCLGGGSTWSTGGAELDVGASGSGTLTISDGAEVDVGQLYVGNNSSPSGTVYVESGATLTSQGPYDQLGVNNSNGSVTVTGAGSTWVGYGAIVVGNRSGGTGTLSASDGARSRPKTASTFSLGAHRGRRRQQHRGLLHGGAATGALTIDAGSSLYGDGGVDAAVIDNGVIHSSDGALTINGAVSGSGTIAIGGGSIMTISGAVSNTGGVYFNGWNGILAIGDSAEFTAPIYNYLSGDTIDLTDLAYDGGNSSYIYTPGVGGGTLSITEGATTVNLAVNEPSTLTGQLQLSADDGTGTKVQFIASTPTPFNLWSTLPNFFFTDGDALDGTNWSTTSAANDGYPVWLATGTASSDYVQGDAATYDIDLTSQDFSAASRTRFRSHRPC